MHQLAELFQELAKQSIQASKPNLETADPTKTYAVRSEDGIVTFIGGEVPWRKHEASDLVTIVAFAERFAANADGTEPAIWYSRDLISCLLDDDDRRQRVSVRMIRSAQIDKLRDLEHKQPMLSQRDTLFMLRTVFTQNAFPTAPKLIELLRNIKFESGAKSEGDIQRGKSSVGKSLTASASFLGEVPEQVTLSVPLFTNSFARHSYDVQCALEIYEAEMKLQLFPLPGEVEKAFAAAEADISAAIRELLGPVEVPVYYGNPN